MFFENNKASLNAFTKMSLCAGARADYVQGGGGNTSVKVKGGMMAIKASGYCLSDIRPDAAYAVLEYEPLREFYYSNEPERFDDVEKAGAAKAKDATQTIEGLAPLRPSVEAGFHSLLDTYVLHSHSVYANLAACCDDCEAIAAGALAGTHYTWGVVPYVNPGARLTFAVRDELRRLEACGKRPAVLFMRNHGLIVHNEDAESALSIHKDVNDRIAAFFGMDGGAFPAAYLADIVERDEREAGERRKLNLGHTFAHAIERTTDRYTHGEAVSIGMVMAARIAVRAGMLGSEDERKIVVLLEKFGLPTHTDIDPNRLLKAIRMDKKGDGDSIRFVLPTGIGSCEVRRMGFGEVEELATGR